MWQKIFTCPKREAPGRAYFTKDTTLSHLSIEYILSRGPTQSQNTHTYTYLKMEISLGNSNHLLLGKVIQVKLSAFEISVHNI